MPHIPRRVRTRTIDFRVLLTIAALALLVAPAARLYAETDPAYGIAISSEGIAINPRTHTVYAVDARHNTLVVAAEAAGPSRRIVKSVRIRVGQAPIAVAVNARTGRVYVVNKMSDSVSVVDGATDAVMATIPLPHGAHPYLAVVNEAVNRVYVANTYSGTLSVIDGATNRAVEIPAGNADGMVLDPSTGAVNLISYEGHDIRTVDPRSGAVQRVLLPADAWGIAFAPAANALFVGLPQANAVAMLNLGSHQTSRIPVGAIPCALAVDPAAHRAYVVNYGSDSVSVIDTRTHAVVATVPVGSDPQAIAVDSTRHRVYVANAHGNSVTVIATPSNTVLATVPVGKGPYALALDLATGRVFAAARGKQALVAIPMPPPASRQF